MRLRPRLLPTVMLAASALLALKVADLWSGVALAQTPASTTPPAANAAPSPAATPSPTPTPAPTPTPTPESAAPPAAATANAPAATPTDAPAKAANAAPDPLQMSPEEVGELQQLSGRRVELDKRAAELSEREVLLQATEKRIDEKIAKLQSIEQSVESAVKARNAEEDARVQSLAHMYEQMKPADAARILDQLDVPTVLTLFKDIRELKAAPILAAMDPDKAKAVTLALTDAQKDHATTPGNGAQPAQAAAAAAPTQQN